MKILISILPLFFSFIFPNNVPLSENLANYQKNIRKKSIYTLTIEITNVRNAKGQLLVAVYNQSEGFPKKQDVVFRTLAIPAKKGKMTASFTDIPPGRYAVATLHDENKNIKMDWTIIGLPKEGFGFSNDARGFMAPPSFKKASFRVNEDKSISFKTSYFL